MATVNLGRIKPVFRGAYSGSTAYVVDDIVTHGNESFICIQAHGAGTQATSQTAYWTKLAAKGADGTDVGTTLTTQGDILFRDGSGLQRLAKGTAAQVLKMNTAANAPEWGTDAGGAQTLLASGTSTNQTQIAFDSSLITTTYQIYNLYFTAGARNSQDMRVYYSSDNGSNYVNVDRFYEHIQLHSGGSTGTGIGQASVNASDGMIITKNNVAGDIGQGLITVYKPNVSGGSSARWNKGGMHSRVITQQNPGSSVNIEELRGVAMASQAAVTNTFVVNNFKIFTTGNFDIRYALYGLKLGS